MNQKQIRAAVEAMLFASGDPIGADKLAQAVQLPQLSVEAALEALRERYAREDSGLCLLHLNTRWQLATKTEWADCIRRLLDSRRAVPLGPAAMETLTVIAYNQPVSRAFIEQVRGVDSSSSVSGLLEKGLIEEAGRLDEMLDNMADGFDFESEKAIDRLIAMLEPAMIVLLAVGVGIVMVSVLLPLYTMYQNIG